MHSELAGYRPGELVRDRYEIHEPLGVGRFGATVLAFDTETERKIILKIIHPALLPTPEHGRQFLTGARALGRGEVNGLTRVYGANCEGERYFIVRELVEGFTLMGILEDRRADGRVFELEETLRVLEQVADIVDKPKNSCHGALIPTKIWLDTQSMKIADAGLLSLFPIEAGVHLMKKARRFRGYIAPELWAGREPTPQTDVYCATALLGEMTTQITFDGRKDIFRQNAPDLCGSFDSVLQRGLAENPSDRFATIGELVDALYYLSGLDRHRRPVMALRPQPEADEAEKEAEAEIESAFRELGLADDAERSETFDSVPTKVHEAPNPSDEEDGAAAQVSMEDVIRAHIENSSPPPPERPVSKNEPLGTKTPPFNLPPEGIEDLEDTRGAIVPSWEELATNNQTKGDGPESIEEAAQEATGRFDVSELRRKEAERLSSKKDLSPRIEPPKPRPRNVDSTDWPTSPEEKSALPRPNLKGPAPAARKAPISQNDGTYMITPRRPEVMARPPKADPQNLESKELDDNGDITQEIDLDDLTPIDSGVIPKSRLPKSPEEQSTEELIRRAERLEGIDPRLVRAAHALETKRRTPPTGSPPHKPHNDPQSPNGIDPRFLKAAAELDSRRESSALPESASSFHATKKPTALADIDPRLLRAAARLEFQKKRVPEDRVVISPDDVTQTESGVRRRNAEFVSFLGSEEQPPVSRRKTRTENRGGRRSSVPPPPPPKAARRRRTPPPTGPGDDDD